MSAIDSAFVMSSWSEGVNKQWIEKERQRKENCSNEGMKQKLQEQLQLDFSTFTKRNVFYDDGCSHYSSPEGINYKYC